MKRLLLSLTAALALGAYAETGDYGGTGFESLTPGNALDIAKNDAGGDGAGFWEGKEGEEYGVISNHIGAVEVAGLNGKNNYLKVEADSTLYRYAIDNAQPTRTIDVKGKAGIYFDSLVQFTGSEEIMVNNVDDRAKLAVWLYQCDTEDGVFGIGTNLVVTAGYLDAGNNSTATNYVTTLSLAEGWHRLTVKMIPELGTNSEVPGFVVFIDGVAVQNAETKGDNESVMGSLNAIAAKWAGENALFPSMIAGDNDAQTFECVGFKGQGALDELLVTENAPEFAADGTIFTLNWDAGLASLTIDGEPVDSFVAGEKGTTNINVTAGTPTYEVLATAQAGYNLGERVAEGGVVKSGDNGFKVNGTGIGTIVVNQAKFIVNDKPYSTLADAIVAAGANGTIKLGADITVGEDDLIELKTEEFVLDLAGHDLYGSCEESPVITLEGGATLTIIDSVGGGVISGGSTDEGCVYSEGSLTIGATTGDAGVTIDGYAVDGVGEGAGMSIVKGNFLIVDNYGPGEFEACIDPGSTFDTVAGYYVVTPSGEPPVTKYEITWDALENATVSAADTNGKPVESGNKFIEGTEIVFTVDPDADYTYADVEIGTWTLLEDGTISNLVVIGTQDVKVTIPEPAEAPAPTTYAVSFYTNSVDEANLVAVTNIAKDAELTAAEIPAIFDELEGAWDNEPVGAVITEETNFVFTIKAPEPTMWTVTFSTNTLNVAEAETNVVDGGTLALDQIPEFVGGTWDVDPATAVITCATNFNYTIAAGKTYPTYIMDHASDELKAKFDEWATNVAKDRDTESANLDAFLLNCAPDKVEEAKKAFKITSIEKVSGEWVVKACDKVDGEEYLNGYVNIVPYDINGEAADPANAEFFQATLTIQPVNTTEE